MIKNQNKLLQYVVASAAICVFGLSFDGFWHLTRGRETFFALPHLFVYGGIIAAINFTWQGFKQYPSNSWRWLLRGLSLIPLAAPLDEIWHRVVGKETIDSPLIIWSPPHLVFLFAALFSLFLVAQMVKNAEKIKSRFSLGPAVLGLFLNILIITLMPLHPLSPHAVLGASGLGVISAATLITYFLSRRMFPEFGTATIVATVLLLFQMIIFDANYYLPESENFFHLPDWTLALVYLTPALLIDSTDTWYAPSRGMLAGLILGIILFYIGGYAPGSPYVYADLWSGAITSALGGIFAGIAFEHLLPTNKKTA